MKDAVHVQEIGLKDHQSVKDHLEKSVPEVVRDLRGDQRVVRRRMNVLPALEEKQPPNHLHHRPKNLTRKIKKKAIRKYKLRFFKLKL